MGTIAEAVAGLLFLYFGGDALIRGATALAMRFGVSPLTIGLTVVAFGTSAPELVVSLKAALAGANDISVGNVVGSNIANIALILGLSALICPAAVSSKLVLRDAPIMIVASVALVLILLDRRISRIDGVCFLIGLLVYTVITFRSSPNEVEEVQEEITAAAPVSKRSGLFSGAEVVLGLAALIAGGHFLVSAAVTLATGFGLSQAATGLTIVAVGTSLPELSTTVMASLRGRSEIAIGGIVGSNIFNLLGILGGTAIVHPLEQGGVSGIDLGVMVGLACVLALFILTHSKLSRVEGAILLVSYVGYVTWLLVG